MTNNAKLSFEKHIEQIYAKARTKLNASEKNIQKKSTDESTFLDHFSYSPLGCFIVES